MTNMNIQTLEFNGAVLERGFWLYAWKITPPNGEVVYYVGRTGDESSPNAASPFKRLGIHLDVRAKGNCLWRLLREKEHDPSKCHFQLASYGPVFKEVKNMEKHKPYRDRAAGMERKLMEWFRESKLPLLNKAEIRREFDPRDNKVFKTAVQEISGSLNLKKK